MKTEPIAMVVRDWELPAAGWSGEASSCREPLGWIRNDKEKLVLWKCVEKQPERGNIKSKATFQGELVNKNSVVPGAQSGWKSTGLRFTWPYNKLNMKCNSEGEIYIYIFNLFICKWCCSFMVRGFCFIATAFISNIPSSNSRGNF